MSRTFSGAQFMLKQAPASYPAAADLSRRATITSARVDPGRPPAIFRPLRRTGHLRPRPKAPVAELVDALELKIEFRKECWFDSGQGHQGENTNENNVLSHWFNSTFLRKFSNLVENTGKKLAQPSNLLAFLLASEIKTIAANFAIRRAPNEVGLRNQRMDRETRIGTRRSIKSKYLFSSALVFTILPPASCSQ